MIKMQPYYQEWEKLSNQSNYIPNIFLIFIIFFIICFILIPSMRFKSFKIKIIPFILTTPIIIYSLHCLNQNIKLMTEQIQVIQKIQKEVKNTINIQLNEKEILDILKTKPKWSDYITKDDF